MFRQNTLFEVGDGVSVGNVEGEVGIEVGVDENNVGVVSGHNIDMVKVSL